MTLNFMAVTISTIIVAALSAIWGGVTLTAIIVSLHRRPPHPPLWVKGVMGVGAAAMYGIALGYVGLLRGQNPETPPPLWPPLILRLLASTLYIVVPLTAWYVVQLMEARDAEQRVHEAFVEEFVRNTSHELRTPLTIIKGFSELLHERWTEMPQTAVSDYIGYIHHQAENMHYLIQNILHFQKGRVRDIPDTAVDFTMLVNSVCLNVSIPIARPTGVKLSVDHLDAVTVTGHIVQLELIVNNLLMNAVKFSPKGNVYVSLHKEVDTAVLTIMDNGIGIPPEIMPRIFEAFVQGDGSDTRPYGGLGLGLAVVKDIVEDHHGRVAVESEVGKGSTFTVYLPIRETT